MLGNLSEQEILRRNKKNELEKLGFEPYPSVNFQTSTSALEILNQYEACPDNFKDVIISGRLMSRRIMGSASFSELKDDNTKIQLYINRDSLCSGEDKSFYNIVFKKLLDIGDIIGVRGYVFKTKVGEISIHVTELKLLSKSLRPLPIVKETDGDVYDAFSDPEHRYRQRYVDLIVNSNVKRTFETRTKVFKILRKYFDNLGCLEVETPVLQNIYGGAHAKPFKTFHNALNTEFYLRIAPELYLKRLIVGGYKGVYEFAKLFRNEGMSRFHNPEFTILEAYVAYKDYTWMMNETEKMLEEVVKEIHNSLEITVDNQKISFQRPWKKYSMYQVIHKYTGVDVSSMDEANLRNVALEMKIDVDVSMDRGKIIDEIFSTKCEPNIVQPTFITDYPVEMSPLAKKKSDNPSLVERFELIVNGKELMNSYSELNDPIDQRERFKKQLELTRRGDKESMVLDEDFLRALEYGMPPTVGMGIGIDRLTMILTNSKSIQDVIFFPHMRPENF